MDPIRPPITTSVFELFKAGPGPSSSHTIGPMEAGNHFLAALESLEKDLLMRGSRVEVRLFGSLSATGKGHGTDRAVLAGLMGHAPESCRANVLDDFAEPSSRNIQVHDHTLSLPPDAVVFDDVGAQKPFSNTLAIQLLDRGGEVVFEREYYSVGGGFLQVRGEDSPPRGRPRYPYSDMAGLKHWLNEHGMRLHKLMLENERAITGASEREIWERLRNICYLMESSVENGLKATGVLPGPIGLKRKARAMIERFRENPDANGSFMIALSAYAFAVSEENASGHRIVTAPTCGSAGVVPAVMQAMRHHLDLTEHSILEGLLAAAAIGFLVKHNASVAGAEVGCQGEVGVASAMAAAMLAYAEGYSFQVVENAAESALEHHLGLTCDPVSGLVQIPCIERNAMGAVKAFNAYLIASSITPGRHVVGLDHAIRAMAETGRDMNAKYKETSRGGLALGLVNC